MLPPAVDKRRLGVELQEDRLMDKLVGIDDDLDLSNVGKSCHKT
jgi:hypothetical protein